MVRKLILSLSFLLCCHGSEAWAQEATRTQPPDFTSTSVSADRKVTFRVFAPNAKKVSLVSSDIPALPQSGLSMTQSDSGVWEATTDAVAGGAYRYHFAVDGVSVIDPRNSTTSESNSNAWSLVTVEGSNYSDLKDVPHGTVGQVRYFSKSLNRFRRLHVYTPPSYETGTESLPVLYLLHGAFDCDASWSTVGQAGSILDNLISEGKAKPMVVVMPMGHTGPLVFGPQGNFQKQMEEFVQDFQKDIKPLVETRYRVRNDRKSRAIAGLSMGGAHTMDIAFADLSQFAYLGVFSSGVFGMERGTESGPGANWLASHKPAVEDPELKKDLKLIWFATGKQDFLMGTTKATVNELKRLGFEVTFKETEGGHTWLNWREYLHEFAPKLFVD
jgi:enterochelin esterase-like enzyme